MAGKTGCFYISFIFFQLVCCVCYSQPARTLHFETLTINDGLSQGYVSSITQDKKGFLWMATSDGLNMFDGYKFTVYHHKPEDGNSPGSDDLSFLFEDSKERLWVCTRYNGLDLFDRKTQTFTHFRYKANGGLSSDNINSIGEDKTGAFWIITANGADRMVITPKTRTADTPGSFLADNKVSFTHVDISSKYKITNYQGHPLFIDKRGNVFLLTGKNVIRLVFSEKTNRCRFVDEFSYAGIKNGYIQMVEDTKAQAYILIAGNELFNVPGYNFGLAKPIFKSSSPVYQSGIDSSRMLWMASNSRVIRLNLSNNKAEEITGDNNVISRFINYVIGFYFDHTGVVWMGTGGYGVLKFNQDKEKFHHLLNNVYAGAIHRLPNQHIVINDNLNFPYEDHKFGEPVEGNFNYLADKKGNTWYPGPGVMVKLNVKTRVTKRFTLLPGDIAHIPNSFIIDDHNNVLVIYANNLIRVDTNDLVSAYPLPPVINDHTNAVYTIFANGGTIWIGTDVGLLRFDLAPKKWLYYGHKENNIDNTSLNGNYILSVLNDPQLPGKYLWIGTKGGGLNRLDKQTGKIVFFTTNNGLPNNVIYGILPDDAGNLWLSTNRGLSQFNTGTGKCRNFTVSDGLQSSEFNSHSYCKLNDGTLVFGGVNGINYFDPVEIKPLNAPNVVLTDFKLFNRSVDFKKDPAIFSQDIAYIKNVQLKYDQNEITIQFAAMDYRKTEAVQYRYKLKGFNNDWVYSKQGREANYTNLDPGAYTFFVEASNGDNLWSAYKAALLITVLPMWWQTWWFYLMSAAAILLLLYSFYRFRINQLLKIDRVRNNIAKDLHDEIGSSLSAISIFSKVATEQLRGSNHGAGEIIKKISENVQGTMDAMNDIVWSVNAKNDDLDNVINRMREHAFSLLEIKGYQLHFLIDDNVKDSTLEMGKRKDLFLIYKEALNNISKYARGTEVWISITSERNNLKLTVEDNGVGFDESKISKSSNGVRNMKARALSLNGTFQISAIPGKGTRLEISFKK